MIIGSLKYFQLSLVFNQKSKEIVTKAEFIKFVESKDTTNKDNKVFDLKIVAFPVDGNNASYRRFKVNEKSLVHNDTLNHLLYYTLRNEDGVWKVIWTKTLLTFGRKMFDDGNYGESRKALKSAIDLDPFSGYSYDLLAWCYLRDNSVTWSERENEIVKNVKYALSLEVDNASHYSTMAAYYSLCNNNTLAIQYYEKGLAYCTNKNDQTSYFGNLASLYLGMRKYEYAEVYLQAALKIDTTNTYSLMLYGSLMRGRGDKVMAAKYYRKAIASPSMDIALQSQLYFEYAESCFDFGDYTSANEYVLKSIEMDPQNSKSRTLFNKIKRRTI